MRKNNEILYPVDVECECPICGHSSIVVVDFDDFQQWCKGKFVQDAFPYLSPNDREKLITGICPSCWNAQFMGYDE